MPRHVRMNMTVAEKPKVLHRKGDEPMLPDDVAERWIRFGWCVPLDGPKQDPVSPRVSPLVDRPVEDDDLAD